MTASVLSSQSSLNKISKLENEGISSPKISLAREPKLNVKIEDDASGFRSLGKSKEIVELTIDPNNRIMARYRNKARRRKSKLLDDNVPSFAWVVIGKLLLPSNNNGKGNV